MPPITERPSPAVQTVSASLPAPAGAGRGMGTQRGSAFFMFLGFLALLAFLSYFKGPTPTVVCTVDQAQAEGVAKLNEAITPAFGGAVDPIAAATVCRELR